MEIYVTKSGDTLENISTMYNISTEKLAYDNQLIYPYALAVGQALLIDTGVENIERDISTLGYAYPFISTWVLDQTLPYLTDLAIFSYGFTAEGNLIPPILDDQWMIDTAINLQSRPILTLTPFGEDGNFNNILINKMVNNEEAKWNLIDQLLKTMKEKKYVGIDIDFEFILAEDKNAFTLFVQDVARTMRSNGYTTSVALAPKSSADQKGVVYEGKDYKALGEAADYVLTMTYEWGYTYGPPMAVAPINQVKNVVEYAVTEIPSEKINLGIPNYGYDWPLPYERGVTAAVTIGNVEAVQIAVEVGAEILYDELAQSPYFYYTAEGIEHVVWFEDVRSLNAKFNLIVEYNLRGCGYWQIMQWFRANWLLLASRFTIL